MTTSRRPSRDVSIVIAVALLVGFARYAEVLLRATPLGDESAYLCAFDAVASGADPYASCPRFLYLPALAHAGAGLASWFGAHVLQYALRLLVLSGSAAMAGLMAEATGASLLTRCAVAGLGMLSPPVAEGIEVGNLSAPAAALTWLALLSFQRAPIRGGAALALALLVKPVAPLGPLALLLVRGGARQAALRAVTVFGAVLGIGLMPWTGALPRLGVSGVLHDGALHNVSIARILAALDVHVPALWIAVAVAASFLVALRTGRIVASEGASRYLQGTRRLAAAAVCGSLLALPVVWNHTLVIALPLLGAATSRACSRWRGAAGSRARADALLTLLLVTGADLAVLGSDVFGELFDGDPWAALPLLLPLSAPTFLAVYAAAPGAMASEGVT